MNEQSFASSVVPALHSAHQLILQIEKARPGHKLITFIEFDLGIYLPQAYVFHRLVRHLPSHAALDLLLESHGGSIDAAASIASICKARFPRLCVLVPFTAKSAASLIALTADELVMARSAQLGPIDPQVRHPEKDIYIPAHSIRDALRFIEETKDPFVKLSMAEKLDPLLIGAYEDAKNVSAQYLEEAAGTAKGQEGQALVHAFTERFKSHGYPIDRRVLEALGFPHVSPLEPLESLMYSLHECYLDRMLELGQPCLIIQTADGFHATIGDLVRSGRLQDYPPEVSLAIEAAPEA